MTYRLWTFIRHPALPVILIVLAVIAGGWAYAQDPVAVRDAENETAPISPKVSPGPMSLDQCLEMGFQHQPSLDAARASLNAAHSGQAAVNKMIFPRLIRKDLPIRREQSGLGVTIANAALCQAEVDTRYAITRNFFTVQYIRAQQAVITDVLRNLDEGYKKAETIAKSGDPNAKITMLDVRAIKGQIAIVNARKAQADNGMLRALAALREAMGLAHDYPLEIAVAPLPPPYVEKVVAKGKTKTIEFTAIWNLSKDELINSAIANRGELVQANAFSRVTELEVQAQQKIFGYKGNTFAWASDPHVQPLPYSAFNGEYKPGAIGPEAPANLVGRKPDRMQRAHDLHDRANAVVDKATNLVSLDVENQFLKWREASDEYRTLKAEFDDVQALPADVLKLMQNKDLTGAAIIQANLTAVTYRTQLNDALHLHALALAGLERATAGAFRVYPIPEPPANVPK